MKKPVILFRMFFKFAFLQYSFITFSTTTWLGRSQQKSLFRCASSPMGTEVSSAPSGLIAWSTWLRFHVSILFDRLKMFYRKIYMNGHVSQCSLKCLIKSVFSSKVFAQNQQVLYLELQIQLFLIFSNGQRYLPLTIYSPTIWEDLNNLVMSSWLCSESVHQHKIMLH